LTFDCEYEGWYNTFDMTLMTITNSLHNFLAAGPSMVLIDGPSPISLNADANSLVDEITKVGLGLGVAVAIILVTISGYKMIMSKGDPKGIQDAQDQIQNAIMGFLLILAAVSLVRLILAAVGITGVVG
jgi:hypothetical protein